MVCVFKYKRVTEELVDEGVNFSGGSRGGAWGALSPLIF